MKVHWTISAIEHLRSIHDYIARDSPSYAQIIVERLTRRSIQIEQYPLSGRPVPEASLPQIRELLEGPYRIIYHINAEQIDVLAVIHGAQQSPWNK
jgi:toxin ParE1/3/4